MYTKNITEPPLIHILITLYRLHPPLQRPFHTALGHHPAHADILHLIARIARRSTDERYDLAFCYVWQQPWARKVADGTDEERGTGEEWWWDRVVQLDPG